MSRLKHFLIYLILIVLSIGLWQFAHDRGVLEGIEQEALRWRYLARGELESTAPIIFVDLDPAAVAHIGDKPWDRKNFGQAVSALMNPGGAKVVGLDIIFSSIGSGGLLDVERARQGDLFFGQVVESYADQVVLAVAYTGTTSDRAVLPLRRNGYYDSDAVPYPESPTFPIVKNGVGRVGLANVDEALNSGSMPLVVATVFETSGEGYSRNLMAGYLRYFGDLLDGIVVVEQEDALQLVDGDGFAPVTIPRQSDHTLFSLGLEMFLAAHDLHASAVTWGNESLLIRKDGAIFREIPLIGGQSTEVNWFQGWESAIGPDHISMSEVLTRANALGAAAKAGDTAAIALQEAWFAQFKDKVIFIGPVDATLKDLAPTPFNRTPMPKVGLHANFFRTIQDEAYIRRMGDGMSGLLCIVLTILVACLALWSGRGRSITRIGSIMLLIGYVAYVFYIFAAQHLILPLIAPLGAAITASLLTVFTKLGSEEWQRHRLKALFGAYVSPELVKEMSDKQRDPELGGTSATITALFSDVEGFSVISEQLPPEDLVNLMNEYLGAMTEALHTQGGTLDKYIGDAIVTMFGMPLPIEDHAAKACLAAVRMQECHAELRKRWALEGRWPVAVQRMQTRIGINTGEAVIGNMGSKVRFNYTMMGDSVNLAARCESGAKSYGVYTMVTGPTMEEALAVLPDLRHRKLDRIIVKGRSEPVDVYELWDRTTDPQQTENCKKLYDAGLAFYIEGDWKRALEKFALAEAYEPYKAVAATTPSAVLAKRCQDFIEHGGPEDWTGAYKMLTK